MPPFQSDRSRRGLGLRVRRVGWVLLLASVIGCRPIVAESPALREPLLSFEGPALRKLLRQTKKLAATPLGLASSRILSRIEHCDEVFAQPGLGTHPPEAAEGSPGADAIPDFLSALSAADFACSDHLDATPSALVRFASTHRAQNQGLLLWPMGDSGRLELRFDLDESGSLEVAGLLVPDETGAGASLLLPSRDAPADAAIEPEGVLAHLRMRPKGGLQLSQWLEAGGQADRLFALKGRLLEGALLEDTWEVAVLPPSDQGSRPMLAGALHHRLDRLTGPLRNALEEALTKLESTWPIQRTPRNFLDKTGKAHAGACFLELPLLPDLAPCWVVTDRALIIGDQPAALEAALLGVPRSFGSRAADAATNSPQTPSPGRSGLRVDFGRMRESDRQLAPGVPRIRPSDLWSTLRVDARPNEADQILIDARLETRS